MVIINGQYNMSNYPYYVILKVLLYVVEAKQGDIDQSQFVRHNVTRKFNPFSYNDEHRNIETVFYRAPSCLLFSESSLCESCKLTEQKVAVKENRKKTTIVTLPN